MAIDIAYYAASVPENTTTSSEGLSRAVRPLLADAGVFSRHIQAVDKPRAVARPVFDSDGVVHFPGGAGVPEQNRLRGHRCRPDVVFWRLAVGRASILEVVCCRTRLPHAGHRRYTVELARG